MTAGLFLTGNIWRLSASGNDDAIGGANPSGTIVYSNVFSRIQAAEPTMALLEQGLETPTIFEAILTPGNIDVHHNDQYEVTSPVLSPYYGKRFRIIGVQNSSMLGDRSFLIVTMRRIVEANSNVLQ